MIVRIRQPLHDPRPVFHRRVRLPENFAGRRRLRDNRAHNPTRQGVRVDYKDYYKILGVEKTASADEIKKAYRRLARKYHPDVSKEPDAAERMSEINEANTVLSDPERRAAYDQLGDAGQFQQGGFQPPPGWQGAQRASGFGGFGTHRGDGFEDGAGYSSFFEELFGRGQAFRRGGQPHDMRGSDQHATIHMTVPESYSGAKRTLALRTVELDDEGHAHERVRELEVSIPKGVREGQMIRLAGKGQPGMGHGPAGDLLLEVKFADDKRWHAEGKDVYQQVHVTPWQAALGGPVEFHTLAGTFQISVPPGSQSGRKLRIRGKGLPAKEPGDLYLVLEITVPVPTTDAQREAYAALARAFGNPTNREDSAA